MDPPPHPHQFNFQIGPNHGETPYFHGIDMGLKYHKASLAHAYGNGAIYITPLRTKMLQSHP